MTSPPQSPPRLQGASRTTGGIIRGRAYGNALNHADFIEFGSVNELPLPSVSQQGRVHVYTASDQASPAMSFKHPITSSLAPVLRSLARRYSPASSRYHQIKFQSTLFNII